jgi:hypothetical protein
MGLIQSRPRYKLIGASKIPMKEIYLNNDHLVDYRAEERTTGMFVAGLSLTAFLTLNPTGSAIVSEFLTAPVPTMEATSSFALTQVFSASYSASVTQSFTASVYQILSQSFTASVSVSNAGLTLTTSLTETPARSGEYIGTIPGADITTALSGSFIDGDFSSSFTSSNSVTVSQSYIPATEWSQSFTYNITHSMVESFSASIEVQLVETAPRAWSIYEVVTSGDGAIRIATPFNLRSVRFGA